MKAEAAIDESSRRAPASPSAVGQGIVFLVGAGPGDPGLLTVRGRTLLWECDAVVYDALANAELLEEARGERFDVGKRGGVGSSTRQEDINALLVRLAREGKRVVRLKGGDPFVFGRGGEEALALAAARVPFEVVPGVTAGIAAPAYAGIPVTHRGLATSVTFVTGHEDPVKGDPITDWRALGRAGGTIVLFMGVASLAHILGELERGGLSPATPAAAVRWGTSPRQRTVVATLSTLADRVTDAGLTAPVITIIGEVVSLREHVAWVERRPLFGKRILVTRAASRTTERSSLGDALANAGADVLDIPATRIEPLDAAPLRNAVTQLARFDWIVFTSQNAVALFWSALVEARLDARALATAKLAAVGPATAEALATHGLTPDVVPGRFVAEALLESLRARQDVRGARQLYVSAADARPLLSDGMRELEADVCVVPAYKSVADDEGAARLRAALDNSDVDLATFTSASAVNAFVKAAGAAALRVPAASIGPVTSDALRAVGIEPAIEARQATMADLVDAIVDWAGRS